MENRTIVVLTIVVILALFIIFKQELEILSETVIFYKNTFRA